MTLSKYRKQYNKCVRYESQSHYEKLAQMLNPFMPDRAQDLGVIYMPADGILASIQLIGDYNPVLRDGAITIPAEWIVKQIEDGVEITNEMVESSIYEL